MSDLQKNSKEGSIENFIHSIFTSFSISIFLQSILNTPYYVSTIPCKAFNTLSATLQGCILHRFTKEELSKWIN